MFSKIVIALNDLAASQRVLRTGIGLARTFSAELGTVSILGDLPLYTSLAVAVDPGTSDVIDEARQRAQRELHEQTSQVVLEQGVSIYDFANEAPCSVLGVYLNAIQEQQRIPVAIRSGSGGFTA